MRVVAAMSGGVDSSVAAAMLLEKGHEVIGITMQLWPRENDGDKPLCCGIEAIETARKVSNQLGITHYVMDFRKTFKEKVIKDFCSEYSRGRTPNPCIRCNQYIKFDILLKKARALGAGFISTGHYARIDRDMLKKAVSGKNDQSYFLYTLTKEQLNHILFPLGEFTKDEVREYAGRKKLVNSNKEASQETCFTGGRDYREFLSKYIENEIKPGPIVNTKGDIIGRHKGLQFYTVGQREGLGISFGYPLYVIKTDTKNNKLVVGTGDEVYSNSCELEEVKPALKKPLRAKVRIRHKHEPQDAEIIPTADNRCRVVFDKPQRAVTPGQAAVFYDEDVVLGGGIIAG